MNQSGTKMRGLASIGWATICVWSVIAASSTGAQSANDPQQHWGHWRGENGNGISTTAKPPTQWSETENVKWKVPIAGRGSGSPVVWGDQVFVVTALAVEDSTTATGSRPAPGSRLGKMSFRLLSFDRNSGEQQWEQIAVESTPHQGVHETNNFAPASPCTDGKHVYAFFGSRGLYCYTLEGKLIWKRDDFGKIDSRNGFGEGASPTIAGDKIIVPWDHEGPSALYALDKTTGDTIWKTDRDEPTNWSTPLIVAHQGSQQIVINGQTCARGYDLESGKELWRCGGQTQRPCASAVAGEGIAFVGSGHQGSFLGAFDLNGRGDLQNTSAVLWTIQESTPDIASPLLSGNRLYFHKAKIGNLSCVNAKTGEPYYMTARVPKLTNIYASPVAAGGFVFLTDRKGTTVVIKDSEAFEVVSVNSVGQTVDATPAPVGNQLFIRGERHLFCIEAESNAR